MADGLHIAEYWKRYNSPINGQIFMKLGWSHPIMPRHVRHDVVAMATAVRRTEHSAWASGGGTRKPIYMKFGTQQQIMTSMTVT